MSDADSGSPAPGRALFGIFRDGGVLIAARMTAQASRLAYLLLVARALGPDLYGVLVYLHAWGLLFLPLANMGSLILLSRAFGRSRSHGNDLAQRLWTLRLMVLPAVALLLIGLGIASEPDAAIRPLFLIVGIALVGRGLAVWCNQVLIANRRADSVLAIEAIFRLGEVAVAALALTAGFGIAGLLTIHATVWWLQAGFSVLWVGATIVRPAWRWRDFEGLPLVRQSLAAVAVGLALFALLQGPVAWGRHLLGTDAMLGQLGLAMQLLNLLVAVPRAIGTVALPVLAGARDDGLGRIYLRTVVPVSLLLALGLAGTCSLVGETVIVLLFGDRFVATARLLTLSLLFVLVPLAPAVLLSKAAMASHRSGALRRAATAALGGLGGGALATLIATDRWGVEGLLIGAGGGAFTWLMLLIRIHHRQDLRTQP